MTILQVAIAPREQFEFGMELRRVEPDENIRSIIGNEIEWDILSCSSIIYTGDVSGTLEEMTVLREGILELSRVFDGEEFEEARCICRDFIIVF